MSYVICKEPRIVIDLMVKKKYQPQLVGYVDRMGCEYKKEVGRVFKGTDEEWVTLKNITSKNGMQIGQLLGLFYSMDWEGLTQGMEDKFYILIHKVRGKKNGSKDWKAAGSGRKGGTGKGSAEAVRHGEHFGTDGGSPDSGACRDGSVCSEPAQ